MSTLRQFDATAELGQGGEPPEQPVARDAILSRAARSAFGPRPLRLGTRGSALALAQTNLVLARLRAVWVDLPIEVQVVRTAGDIDQTSPLTEIGGRGVFTSAIEAAIARGEIDAAVHSAKDLPSLLDPRTQIVAYPLRDDPRDVLVSRHASSLAQLPPHPVIGTSSRRREAQVRRLRPDARVVSIRGNIDTRLRKAEDSELDGIIVAAAGLLRMDRASRICESFAVERFVPSPGQGAIAVQALAGSPAAALLAAIDDPAVSRPVAIERAFLAAVGAGCTSPVGAFAAGRDVYRLVAFLAAPDGEQMAIAEETLPAGAEEKAAAELAARLGAEIAREHSTHSVPHVKGGLPRDLEGARIVVTRPRRQADGLLAALAARGAEAIALPTVRIAPVADTARLDAALDEACTGGFDWLVFTSANGVAAVADRLRACGHNPSDLAAVRIAAVGPATAAAVAALGLEVRVVPIARDAAALAGELRHRVDRGARVLYPRAAIGRETLQEELRAAGVSVIDVAAYRTLPEHEVDGDVLAMVRRGDADAVTFFSPSSVHNFLALVASAGAGTAISAIPAICAGPGIAEAARAAGLRVVATSESPSDAAVVAAAAVWWRGRKGPREDARASQQLVLAGRSTE